VMKLAKINHQQRLTQRKLIWLLQNPSLQPFRDVRLQNRFDQLQGRTGRGF
jgi:hypothetical protein